jgi:hypothetical protein
MYNLALSVSLGRQLRLPVAESMLLIVDRLRARLSQSGDGTKLSAQTREERSPLKSISPALKLALAGLRLGGHPNPAIAYLWAVFEGCPSPKFHPDITLSRQAFVPMVQAAELRLLNNNATVHHRTFDRTLFAEPQMCT